MYKRQLVSFAVHAFLPITQILYRLQYMLFCSSNKSVIVCPTCVSALHTNLLLFAVHAFLPFIQILYRLPYKRFCPSHKSCIDCRTCFSAPHTNLVSLAVCAFVCIILRQSRTRVFPSVSLFAYLHGAIRNTCISEYGLVCIYM